MLFVYLTAAEYCAKLKKEKAEMHKEMDRLKQEIEALTNAIGWVYGVCTVVQI